MSVVSLSLKTSASTSAWDILREQNNRVIRRKKPRSFVPMKIAATVSSGLFRDGSFKAKNFSICELTSY